MLPYIGRYEVASEFKRNASGIRIYRALHPQPREAGADVCRLDLRAEDGRLPADGAPARGQGPHLLPPRR